MEADPNDGFDTVVYFHRADLAYEAKKGPWKFLITPSYRNDLFSGAAGDIFSFRTRADTFSSRAEATRQISQNGALRVGAEVLAGKFVIEAQAPSVPDEFGDQSQELSASIDQGFARSSLYFTGTWGLTPKFTIYPGARLTYNSAIFKRAAFDPRVRYKGDLSDTLALKGGVGLVSQIPDVFEWNSVWGNPRIQIERGVHVSQGIAKTFQEYALSLEVTGFYKYLWDLARGSPSLLLQADGTLGPERFASSGQGHVFGAEVLFRKDLTRNLFGWVSYTLSRSLDRPTPQDPFRPFDFDQPHILTAIVVYKLPHDWQVGARFRLVSGNPSTPISDGVFDATGNFFIPVQGEPNSDRLPPFHQLDLRVDRRWVFRKWQAAVYMDVQNVYNARNVEAINYSYDYQNFNTTAGLPIVPSIGTKIEF
jgi:hypothetical protein